MEKILKAAALPVLLAILALAPTYWSRLIQGQGAYGVMPVHAAEIRTVRLALKGLACASCKYAVKTALSNLDGVSRADVSYKKRRATVLFDPDKVTTQQMIEAIEKIGFQAEILPENGR
ncbi:copper chaperone CopZ [Geothermobacter ehrlichii]|uniref:Copper chaperone CopZ n=1 Tax=Geothermobacter ehrlichii TaxID=213224 RepID=A0A5D3WIA3_9BACT|nr:metal-binding (seleno)protein [Geothermobacter ehrlichii]TYO97607.1 copper chaperone CopZ [Geothermobacter ehrlichii]